jgi:hypothetical protein
MTWTIRVTYDGGKGSMRAAQAQLTDDAVDSGDLDLLCETFEELVHKIDETMESPKLREKP